MPAIVAGLVIASFLAVALGEGTLASERFAWVLHLAAAEAFLVGGVLRLSHARLTSRIESAVIGAVLVVLGGLVILATAILRTVGSRDLVAALELPGRLLGVVVLLAGAAWLVRRGVGVESPWLVVRTLGGVVVVVVGGAATWVAFTPGMVGALARAEVERIAAVGLMVTWFVACAAARRSRSGAFTLAVAGQLAAMGAASALRAGGVIVDPALTLAADLLVVVVAVHVAHDAVRTLGTASDSTRHRAASVASQLVDTRLDLTEASALRSTLRHDAVNSIVAVRGALEMLADGQEVPGTSATLLSASIKELLHLEHMVVRDGAPQAVTFDVDDVVDSVVEARRGTGLQVDVLTGGEQGRGSPGDLATVLQNLLVNAHLHGDARNVTVEVRPSGRFLDVRVVDEGPGVPPEARELIFEPGGRASRRPGAGLGLHIARTLMREQGGDLFLEDVAEGSAFVARLPAARLEVGVA